MSANDAGVQTFVSDGEDWGRGTEVQTAGPLAQGYGPHHLRAAGSSSLSPLITQWYTVHECRQVSR